MESAYRTTSKNQEISNWVKMVSVEGPSPSFRDDSLDPIPFEAVKHVKLPTIGEDSSEAVNSAGPSGVVGGEAATTELPPTKSAEAHVSFAATPPLDCAVDFAIPFEPRNPLPVLPSAFHLSSKAITRSSTPALRIATPEPATTVASNPGSVQPSPDVVSPRTSIYPLYPPSNAGSYAYNGDVGISRRSNPKITRVDHYRNSLSASVSGTSTPTWAKPSYRSSFASSSDTQLYPLSTICPHIAGTIDTLDHVKGMAIFNGDDVHVSRLLRFYGIDSTRVPGKDLALVYALIQAAQSRHAWTGAFGIGKAFGPPGTLTFWKLELDGKHAGMMDLTLAGFVECLQVWQVEQWDNAAKQLAEGVDAKDYADKPKGEASGSNSKTIDGSKGAGDRNEHDADVPALSLSPGNPTNKATKETGPESEHQEDAAGPSNTTASKGNAPLRKVNDLDEWTYIMFQLRVRHLQLEDIPEADFDALIALPTTAERGAYLSDFRLRIEEAGPGRDKHRRAVQFDAAAGNHGNSRPRPVRQFSHTHKTGAETRNLPAGSKLAQVSSPTLAVDPEAQKAAGARGKAKGKGGIRAWFRSTPAVFKWLVGVVVLLAILTGIILLFLFRDSIGLGSGNKHEEDW